MSGFLSLRALRRLGVSLGGKNIQVSKDAILHNPHNITIGNYTRIDAGVVMSASSPISVGDYVHIARNCLFYSGKRIDIRNFVTISAGCKFYGSTDTYDGSCLIGPTIPEKYRNVETGEIVLEDFSSVGTSVVVMPNSIVKTGCVLGASSFLSKTNLEEWTIYAGSPLKEIKPRKRDMIELARQLRNE